MHQSMLELISVFNKPQNDDVLIREAGIPLERALFPLLVVIDRFGPIGVVELADRIGRDHTTVSRQVARLEELELVSRQPGLTDKRVNKATVTPKGKAMTDALDAARDRMGQQVFASWDTPDIDDLVRLVRKFADAVKDDPSEVRQAAAETSQTVNKKGGSKK